MNVRFATNVATKDTSPITTGLCGLMIQRSHHSSMEAKPVCLEMARSCQTELLFAILTLSIALSPFTPEQAAGACPGPSRSEYLINSERHTAI